MVSRVDRNALLRDVVEARQAFANSLEAMYESVYALKLADGIDPLKAQSEARMFVGRALGNGVMEVEKRIVAGVGNHVPRVAGV